MLQKELRYIHNGDNSFIPFGRYSLNPKYAKKGRPKYPDNQGCIAKGWENNWYFDNTFSNPDSNENEYLYKNKTTYSMDKAIVKRLKMKSTLFAVLRLDVKSNPIAVVVVESTNSNKYNENQIKKILEDQKDYLAEMISNLEAYIPKPSNALTIEEM